MAISVKCGDGLMKAMLIYHFPLVLSSKMRFEGCLHLLVLLIKENWYGGESFDSGVNLAQRALYPTPTYRGFRSTHITHR